jgi:tRNA-(MS[2]IO[6]A)-hydroxylase (MiaE)-like
VVNWFSRRKKRVDAPRLRPRTDDSSSTRVDFVDLTPDALSFLGQSAYVQLTIFENLSSAIASAPTTDAKERLSRAASLSLTKHLGLAGEIERLRKVPSTIMEPYAAAIDDFQRITLGADWFENVMTCLITAGMLDEFFARLAEGLPASTGRRVAEVYAGESGEELVAAELRRAIDANPRLAARLALWGRRLVGDTMLVARGALAKGHNIANDEARIEPVFSELIASHTRRMDSLGLTA